MIRFPENCEAIIPVFNRNKKKSATFLLFTFKENLSLFITLVWNNCKKPIYCMKCWNCYYSIQNIFEYDLWIQQFHKIKLIIF